MKPPPIFDADELRAKAEGQRQALELWAYDQATTRITRNVVDVLGNRGEDYEGMMACVADSRQALGISGYGNSGQDRPRPEDTVTGALLDERATLLARVAELEAIRDAHTDCFALEDGERGQVLARRYLRDV